MSKRNVVNEILSKKQRTLPTSRRWSLVSTRLSDIAVISNIAHFIECLDELQGMEALEGFDQIEVDYIAIMDSLGVSAELIRYIPIGLVACIEGYFRKVYADLIDYGSPYRENASKFDIRFSIDTAISLESNSVSIGDFVAHFLTTNNLEDINKNITTLIGSDFLGKFKIIRSQAIRQQYLFPIDDDELVGDMIKSIKRLFEVRHMFCHEVDPRVSIEDMQAIVGYPDKTIEFLWISEFIVNSLLLDYSP